MIKLIVRCSIGNICLLLLAFSAGATNFWLQVEDAQVPTKGKRVLHPKQAVLYHIDQSVLQTQLQRAGTEPENALVLLLPTPSGGSKAFKVWQTPVMEAPLQQKYPGIRTYTAAAVDDAYVSAKLDVTTKGFHAMIFDGNHTYYIDPLSDGSDGYYQAYYKSDYQRQQQSYMACDFGADDMITPGAPVQVGGKTPSLTFKSHGGTKKTYRLALSCTGEYAMAVAGWEPTKADVLAAIVTTMNRVNGIYERELSATMVLVGNNDTLVYLNPATDPFTANNNGGQLMGQNQSNTTNLIGSSNYDIGHIFSTGGGGIASLGSVCSNNRKAMGVTGSSNPVGDPFDVDYVAHEMGHQFGANHTFNACSGTENQETAYEPGGGTTIMAYAGICGQLNNVQMNSSDYFHVISLDEMSGFITEGWFGGGGASCGVSAAGVSTPEMANTSGSYQIPASTPFMLTAPVASGGAMVYGWEQWNLGDFRDPEPESQQFSSGPNFRSYTPTDSRDRVFPVIDSIILNNTDFKGERLSSVDRQLRFKAIARKVENGWGAFNFTNTATTVNVTNTGAPFTVTFPNAAIDTLPRNASVNISWDVAQTDLAPINCSEVRILLSTDGGYTYPTELAASVPNTGTASVAIPDISSTTARIMVKGVDNVFFDISNDDVVIGDRTTSIADIRLENDLNIFPNPASEYVLLQYKGGGTATLHLFNVIGQRMWEGEIEKEVRIPVSSFARGIYYIQISRQETGGQAVKRILLQ